MTGNLKSHFSHKMNHKSCEQHFVVVFNPKMLCCIMCLSVLCGPSDAGWDGDQCKVTFKSSNALCSSAHPTHLTAVPCGPEPVTYWDKRETWVWAENHSCQLRTEHTEAGWTLPAVRQYNDSIDTGALGYWGWLCEFKRKNRFNKYNTTI